MIYAITFGGGGGGYLPKIKKNSMALRHFSLYTQDNTGWKFIQGIITRQSVAATRGGIPF